MIKVPNSQIPKYLSWFIPIRSITLYPFVICIDEGDEILWNHEGIHIAQQKELWIIGFYFLYIYYWLKLWIEYKDSQSAYHLIPFEMEAYQNESDNQYLQHRIPFAWTDAGVGLA